MVRAANQDLRTERDITFWHPGKKMYSTLGVQRYATSRYDTYLDTEAAIRYAIRYFTILNIHTNTQHMIDCEELIAVNKKKYKSIDMLLIGLHDYLK